MGQTLVRLDQELSAFPITAQIAPSAQPLNSEPGFARILLAVCQRWRLLLMIFASIFLLLALVVTQLPKEYTASAIVLLDSRTAKVTKADDVLSALPIDDSIAESEVEVLKSRELANRVAATLKRQGVTLDLKAKKPLTETDFTEQLLKKVSVKREGRSFVIRVAFTSKSPQDSARVANLWVDTYLHMQSEAKSSTNAEAEGWLSDELRDLGQQVQKDEARLQKYKIDNNLLSAAGETLTEQEVSAYNQSLSAARAQVAEDEARLHAARAQLAKGSGGDDVAEALSSPTVQKLREQRAAVSADLASLKVRYGERHPDVATTEQRLADIDQQTKIEINRIISSLESTASASRKRAAAISSSLSGAKGALAGNSQAMVQLHQLQRAADASRTLYESHLARYKEISAQPATSKANARIISKAIQPKYPTAPKVPVFLALCLCVAGGVSAAVLAALEFMNPSFASGQEVEQSLRVRHLASIPDLASLTPSGRLAPTVYVLSHPFSAFVESIRSLRTATRQATHLKAPLVVALTSALPGEGKTTTSVCLARVSAMDGARTIVVDCDVRQKSINPSLPGAAEIGLQDVLRGEAFLSDAIVRDDPSGAHFLPLSTTKGSPSDLFDSVAMKRLLDDLRESYDLIILDTAPVLPIVDTRLLAPLVDTMIVLASWRRTQRPAVDMCLSLLRDSGAHVAGVAITKVDMRLQSRLSLTSSERYYQPSQHYYVNNAFRLSHHT